MEISTQALQSLVEEAFKEGFHAGSTSDFGDMLADGRQDKETWNKGEQERLDCFYRSDAWHTAKKLCGLSK